jgi:subtilisin family serine protease
MPTNHGIDPYRALVAGVVVSVLAVVTLALAEPVSAQGLDPPSDPYLQGKGSWGQEWDDQWAIKRVGFTTDGTSAWGKVNGRSEVVVAVIDTGLDWNHRDISWNNIWRNPGETPDNGVDDDRNGYVDDVIGWNFYANDNKPWDHDGHGTFVSGIIAATWNNDAGIAGINPHARIMVLKGLNNFGHSRASYLAQALVYAADNGAKIINMSVGGKGTTRVERDAMNYAWSKGAVIVVAAGNDATDTGEYGIASIPEAVVVSATDLEDKRATFSNWGTGVDIAAPGLDVLSLRARRTDLMRDLPGVPYQGGAAYVGEDKRYYRSSGTSFAAPIVAGVASLLLTNQPSLSNEEVVRMLLHSARDVELPGIDHYTGYGIVDANAALTAQPDFFVTADIQDVEVVPRGNSSVVRVLGTSDANRFGSAWLELGAGEEPSEWKRVSEPIREPVRDGILGEIPAPEFAGSTLWQLKLVTEHSEGTRREERFEIDLR